MTWKSWLAVCFGLAGIATLLGLWGDCVGGDPPAAPAIREAPAWLTGRWRGEVVHGAKRVGMELVVTSADGDMIIGAMKETHDGRTAMYGLLKIQIQDGQPAWIDYFWYGEQHVRLPRKTWSAEKRTMEFEDMENFWPRNVAYAIDKDGALRYVASGRRDSGAQVETFDILLRPVK